jgi:hypothetical protein
MNVEKVDFREADWTDGAQNPILSRSRLGTPQDRVELRSDYRQMEAGD